MTPLNVTLLGFTIPDDMFNEIVSLDASLPTQTHVFAWNLVQCLRSADVSTSLLSAAPVSNYPRFPKLIVHGRNFEVNGQVGRTLTFVNVLGLKHLTRLVSCLRVGSRFVRNMRPSILLIHGVHSPFLLFAAVIRRRFKVRSVVVITDPPGVVLPDDGRTARVLKRVDVKIVRTLLSACDGVVVLTPQLANDFADGKPALVMEGIVDRYPLEPDADDNTASGKEAKVRFGYAGGLTNANGVDRLVCAAVGLSENVELETFGRGELSAWITQVSRREPRVRPSVFLTRSELLSRYRSFDVLVQPRPADLSTGPYSFPSKLLEYMASGTPVLSTRLKGIPADYEPYLYWIEDSSVDGIQRALIEVCSLPAAEKAEKGRRAADFVRATRSPEARGDALRSFLLGIKSARG